jgi:DNA-binding beta-propeller fold protein YncE
MAALASVSRVRRRAAQVVALLLVAVAGCSATPAAPAHRPLAKLTTGCSTRIAAGRRLPVPAPRNVAVPASPYAAVPLAGGRSIVASLTASGSLGFGGRLAVLAIGGRTASAVRTITLPPSMGGAAGVAVTHDGRLLLVAGGSETAVVSTAGLEHGDSHPALGILRDSGAGQTEVAVSGDDRYAFVTDESSGGLSVFNLAVARRDGFGAPGVAVGIIPLAPGPVGIAVAGARIYVTTLSGYGEHGQLWVIDARSAEHGLGRSAVLGHVPAGCQPVRVAVSPDGRTAWVTALQSDALLGFATAAIERDPGMALRAVVPVGSEPVGLLLLDNGRLALVGNSDRGLVPGPPGNQGMPSISVVSTADALARRPAVTGSLPTGLFPRDLGYDPTTGQVLVANYRSDTVELLRAPAAPRT